jgi:hypothetical protein
MGKMAADSGCLGETAILFSMTRPNYSGRSVPFAGPVPLLVWLMFAAYVGFGMLLLGFEVRAWRRFWPLVVDRHGTDKHEQDV